MSGASQATAISVDEDDDEIIFTGWRKGSPEKKRGRGFDRGNPIVLGDEDTTKKKRRLDGKSSVATPLQAISRSRYVVLECHYLL